MHNIHDVPLRDFNTKVNLHCYCFPSLHMLIAVLASTSTSTIIHHALRCLSCNTSIVEVWNEFDVPPEKLSSTRPVTKIKSASWRTWATNWRWAARLWQISDLKKQTLKLNRISDINSTFKFLSSSNFQFLSCASYLKSHVVIRHADHLQILSHIRTIRYLRQCTLAVENNRYDNYKVGVAQCDIVNSICVAFIILYYDVWCSFWLIY